MYNYKKWMVGLDLTNIDQVVIRYVSFLARSIEPEKVYFINFQKTLDVPEGIREKFPELSQPIDEKCREQMMQQVRIEFSQYERFDIDYLVKEGVPIEEMLRWGHIKNIDLMIAGRKSVHLGSGDLARRMTRKGTSSVMFIPQTAALKLTNLFVAIDFSDYSEMALQHAWSLAKKNNLMRIYCYHVFNLPIGYYSTGKSEQEFTEIMRDNAQLKLRELVLKAGIEPSRVEAIFELQTDQSAAAMIGQSAHRHSADLVLVGAKGRTNATAILLGSVTERLISECEDIPLLVVKQKDKSFSFYDFIKNI